MKRQKLKNLMALLLSGMMLLSACKETSETTKKKKAKKTTTTEEAETTETPLETTSAETEYTGDTSSVSSSDTSSGSLPEVVGAGNVPAEDEFADKQLKFYPFLKPDDGYLRHELKGYII